MNFMEITLQSSLSSFISQIKKEIELFKEKVGNSIINGSVAIKIEFGKLIYEFDIAKNDDLSKLYGTLTITLELDLDLNKSAEAIGLKISKLIGIVGINLTQEMMKLLGVAIIGVMFITFGIAEFGIM